MTIASKAFASAILRLTRYQRRFLLIVLDLVLLNFGLWLAMSARWGFFYAAPTWTLLGLLAAVPYIAIAAFLRSGLYRHVTRHFDALGDQLIFLGVSFSSIGLGLGSFLLGVEGIPRSVLFLYPVFGALLVSGSRRVLKRLITQAGVTLPPAAGNREIQNVVIYGSGQSAQALFGAVRRSQDLEVVAFIDPDPTLWGQYIGGIRIFPPAHLTRLIDSQGVSQVLLAIEKSSRKERLAVLELLQGSSAKVRMLPALEDLVTGRVSVNDLRPIEADDLLGRPPITPNPELMAKTIAGRCVMVTGAGGSIGSELVRQILKHGPSRLVLLSASETSLYEIEAEVRAILSKSRRAIEVTGVLGSVTNEWLVDKALRVNSVQTVYHAAAYKHVPLLERNIIVGAHNNVIGTEILLNAAEHNGVESFVYVSTDKAVRPASLMGATKRLGEMMVQVRAGKGPSTKYAIVRFGNVLDSSGSIVRLFRKQIGEGGPVTVTHPEVNRFFISIPEAAALVIQAAAMAKGGEIYALDMGEPVKILDLAKIMIQLSGLTLRDATNPSGDIEIVFTGLRPGDKLFEEVHLGEHPKPTEHSRIIRVDEVCPSPERLADGVAALKDAISGDDPSRVKKVLSQLVDGYSPDPMAMR